MAFSVVYKPLALLEAKEAYDWYAQEHIGMHTAFLEQLERTDRFLAANPYLYPCVEQTIRRANLNQFPYALFYVIDEDTVNVLSCFHQLREPKSWK
jgi:plasmid stabilization system protein ParE